MKYEKAYANTVDFENDDIIATSSPDAPNCETFQSWDAELCDGVTQAVTKPFSLESIIDDAPVVEEAPVVVEPVTE